MNKIKALIIDDDKHILNAARLYLNRNRILVDTTSNPEEIHCYMDRER